jgi:2-iminobutanoate/2-iminopropanoate deaminase
MRQQVTAAKAAPPKGVYSPAIVAEGRLVFVSGQTPVDPQTGEFKSGSFAEQAKLAFDNVTTLLEAAGTSWQHAVKVGVYLANLTDFGEMNKIYKQYLTEPHPARTTVQVVLPPHMLIEVDCIAVIPKNSQTKDF